MWRVTLAPRIPIVPTSALCASSGYPTGAHAQVGDAPRLEIGDLHFPRDHRGSLFGGLIADDLARPAQRYTPSEQQPLQYLGSMLPRHSPARMIKKLLLRLTVVQSVIPSVLNATIWSFSCTQRRAASDPSVTPVIYRQARRQ
jgi:hypothetical protein